jgi:hypothetical protein
VEKADFPVAPRDPERHSGGMKANLKPANSKARALLKKLLALAERGIDGEKTSAHVSRVCQLWWAVWQADQRAPGARSRVPQGSLAFTVECRRRKPFTVRRTCMPWPVTNAFAARPLNPRHVNEESLLAESPG